MGPAASGFVSGLPDLKYLTLWSMLVSMENMDTLTAEYTHTPKSFFYGQATCWTCGRHIVKVFVAECDTTGDKHSFGTNCHHNATGVDTRIIEARHRQAAYEANRKPVKGPWHGPVQEPTIEIDALFDLDGNLITTNERETRYGWSFYDNDTGRWYSQSQAKNEARRIANNAKKGFYIGVVEVVAGENRNGQLFPLTDGNYRHTLVRVIDNGTQQ